MAVAEESTEKDLGEKKKNLKKVGVIETWSDFMDEHNKVTP